MASRVIPVEDFDLIIFGATGDLSRRKIMPGLFRRFVAGQMPPGARVIGSARSEMTADGFRADIRAAIAEHDGPRADHPQLDEFLSRLDYVTLDATDEGTAEPAWQAIRDKMRDGVIRAAYFSVAPFLFEPLARGLARHGLAGEGIRIVVEKPFGHDLASARDLNEMLARHFAETQIYRIDH